MPYPNHWFSTGCEKATLLELSKYTAYSADLFQWRFENMLSPRSPVCRNTSDGEGREDSLCIWMECSLVSRAQHLVPLEMKPSL